jgi:hypothetical protein
MLPIILSNGSLFFFHYLRVQVKKIIRGYSQKSGPPPRRGPLAGNNVPFSYYPSGAPYFHKYGITARVKSI